MHWATNIVPGESRNQMPVRWRQLQFLLKEVLPQRDWARSRGRLCAQSGTPMLSRTLGPKAILCFRPNGVAERERMVPI
jgi:hypothetical protein